MNKPNPANIEKVHPMPIIFCWPGFSTMEFPLLNLIGGSLLDGAFANHYKILQKNRTELFARSDGSVKRSALANAVAPETDFLKGLEIEDVASIEKEGGLFHLGMDFGEIEIIEFVPLGQHGDGMGAFAGFVWVFADGYRIFAFLGSQSAQNRFRFDLGVIYTQFGGLVEEVAANVDCR